jgi:hypothetical protein
MFPKLLPMKETTEPPDDTLQTTEIGDITGAL